MIEFKNQNSFPPGNDSRRIRKTVLQAVLIVFGSIIVLWLLYALRSILLLLSLTVLFCYIVAPLVDIIERPQRIGRTQIRVPHGLAVVLVYLLLITILAFTIERFLPILSDQLTAFIENAPIYARQFDQYMKTLTALPNRYRLPANIRQSLTDGLNGITANLFEWLKLVVANTLRITLYLPWLILIPIIGFFFLKDAGAISNKILTSFPEADMRYRAALFLKDVSNTIAAYIRAQLLACLIVGLIEGLGLWALGISYPLVFGVAAGVLEFIPLVGPLALGLIATFVASFHSWHSALLVAGFLALFRIIHDYAIYPRLISKGLELHPVAVILAVLCGAELAGITGVFLSVPALALLMVCWRHWRELELGRSSILVKTEEVSLIESIESLDMKD